jgi:hypothetical protein
MSHVDVTAPDGSQEGASDTVAAFLRDFPGLLPSEAGPDVPLLRAVRPASSRTPEEWADDIFSRALDDEQLDALPPAKYVIKGFLYEESLARLIAESGAGKTFAAVSMVCSVATGREWFGHKVNQGSVIYMAAEGARGLAKRFKAWKQEHGVTGAIKGLTIIPEAIQVLADPDKWQGFILGCARLQPTLIVLDTQARVTLGIDENDNSKMGEFVARLDELKTATKGCVLSIHHRGTSQDERARGATSVKGAMDTELMMVKGSEGDTEVDTELWTEEVRRVEKIKLRASKQKDGEELSAGEFFLKGVRLEGKVDEDGESVTSAVFTAFRPVGGAETPARAGTDEKVSQLVKWLDEINVPTDITINAGRGMAREWKEQHPEQKPPSFSSVDINKALRIRKDRDAYLAAMGEMAGDA